MLGQEQDAATLHPPNPSHQAKRPQTHHAAATAGHHVGTSYLLNQTQHSGTTRQQPEAAAQTCSRQEAQPCWLGEVLQASVVQAAVPTAVWRPPHCWADCVHVCCG
jgi:hypothetical protein